MAEELQPWNVKLITYRALVGVYVRCFTTVFHRDRRSHTSKDGSSANEGSDERNHSVKKKSKDRNKKSRRGGQKKGALMIFLPGNAKRVLCQRG